MTKNDYARVIIQALHDLDQLPAFNDPRVVKLSRDPKSHLQDSHAIAMRILQTRLKNGRYQTKMEKYKKDFIQYMCSFEISRKFACTAVENYIEMVGIEELNYNNPEVGADEYLASRDN